MHSDSYSSEKFKRVKLVSKELAQPRAEKMQLGVGAMSLVLLQVSTHPPSLLSC